MKQHPSACQFPRKLLTMALTFLSLSALMCVSAMNRITTNPTSFRIELLLPTGYRFNSMAPSSLTIGTPDTTPEQLEVKNTAFEATLLVPTRPQFTLTGEARVFFCEDVAEPQCFMKELRFKKQFSPDTPRQLQIKIPDPKINDVSS
jgi:hypothetical protein